MEAKELRIGNWIYNGIGEEFQANSETIGNFDVGQSILGHFIPIPLSEEWLLKFGFEKKKGFYCITPPLDTIDYALDYCVDKWNLGRNEDQEQNNVEFFTWDIEHVHQIQNLYFALTGDELEIK